MKLLGVLEGQEVVLMIDFGGSYNFVSTRVVRQLDLPVTSSTPFGVTLAGKSKMGQGVCEQVKMMVGNFELIESYYPLDLGHANFILGIQWLKKLGPVTTNWKLQVMWFEWEGNEVTMKGDAPLGRTRVSL